jgi:hypothetical protein
MVPHMLKPKPPFTLLAAGATLFKAVFSAL